MRVCATRTCASRSRHVLRAIVRFSKFVAFYFFTFVSHDSVIKAIAFALSPFSVHSSTRATGPNTNDRSPVRLHKLLALLRKHIALVLEQDFGRGGGGGLFAADCLAAALGLFRRSGR